MDDRVKKYLLDIITSIESIDEFLGEERNFEAYQESKMLRRAVERELEIIGEALNKADQIDSTLNVENMGKIISLRNRVIHGYDKVDNEIIWGILNRHLPRLKDEIKSLLDA